MSSADLLALLEIVRLRHFGRVVPFPAAFRGTYEDLARHVATLMSLLSDEDLQHVQRMWRERDEGVAA